MSEAIPGFPVELRREIDAPVSMLALEAPPHAAALGANEVWIHDARGWRSEALPAAVRKEPSPTLSLFYGRDERVRVVGTRRNGSKSEAIYLRWLSAGWKVERSEIGRLGDLAGPLVAVLGTADPEIVCRPGDICLIKRRSGWTTVPAPAELEQVVVGEGVGWGLAGKSVLRSDPGFVVMGEPGSFARADGMFALRDRVFVVETEARRIHVFDGARWKVSASPIARPRAMWGTAADALWLAGDGLAFHDGDRWSVAQGAPGPYGAVAGRGKDEVWIAGASGVFRVMR